MPTSIQHILRTLQSKLTEMKDDPDHEINGVAIAQTVAALLAHAREYGACYTTQ